MRNNTHWKLIKQFSRGMRARVYRSFARLGLPAFYSVPVRHRSRDHGSLRSIVGDAIDQIHDRLQHRGIGIFAMGRTGDAGLSRKRVDGDGLGQETKFRGSASVIAREAVASRQFDYHQSFTRIQRVHGTGRDGRRAAGADRAAYASGCSTPRIARGVGWHHGKAPRRLFQRSRSI
jgi:hypothetical protein